MEGVAGHVDHADVGRVHPSNDPQRLEPVFHEVVGVRVDPHVDTFAFEDRQEFFHGAEERAFGFLGAFGAPGELGVDHVDAEVHGDLNDTLPVAHRGFAGIFVGTGPAQHRQYRGDAHPRIGAGLAELGHQLVIGSRVIEERNEIAMRGQLQELVAQIRYHTGEFEQLEIVVERGGIECDPHQVLILSASSTATRSPDSSDRTPAAHTAAAAYPSHAVGPSTLTPERTASTQRCSSMS